MKIKSLKKILKAFLTIICTIFILVAILFLFLTIKEYKPEQSEEIEVKGISNSSIQTNTEYSIITYNIGYAALDNQNDFFMDGGSNVLGRSSEAVSSNLNKITETILSYDTDFVFIQEVDYDSKRSFYIDEVSFITDKYAGENAFALNYKCLYIPYPIPTLGKVNSGLLTLSKYHIDYAIRIQLPVPFSWPLRIANLKRGLLITRIPIDGSDKELVLVNLHLEAYDNGEGKILQTNMLRDVLNDEYNKGNYVIAGGDFNQTFSNVDMSYGSIYSIKNPDYWTPGTLYEDSFESYWIIANDPSTPSCRLLNEPYNPSSELTQYYLIDGFIVSDNIEITSVETINTMFEVTDHNPVVMKFTLK